MLFKVRDLDFLSDVPSEQAEQELTGTVPLTASLEFLQDRVKASDKKRDFLRGSQFGGECVSASGGDSSSTLRVYERDGAYHAYFDFLWDMTPGSTTSTSFQMWLRSLTVNDVVYLHVNGEATASNRDWSKMLDCHDLINTVFICPAKTIYVIDTHVRQGMAYLAVACKSINMTPLGRLTFDKQLAQYDTYPGYKVLASFINKLLARAVMNKILTEEEAKSVTSNVPVTLSYTTLNERLV